MAQVVKYPIGDVFVIAGQSNARGRGDNLQSSTSGSKFLMLQNDYLFYSSGDDPSDNKTGQVDAVSQDSGDDGGSYWPLVGDLIVANTSVNVCFVPCAKGGTAIAEWQPGVDHFDRTTLYGSMAWRALCFGPALKGILWHQGESDFGTGEAAYNTALDSLADAVFADLGVGLVACKLHDVGAAQTQEVKDGMWSAVATAWADNANCLEGADLSGITTTVENPTHLTTDAHLSAAAALWWPAIEALYYT